MATKWRNLKLLFLAWLALGGWAVAAQPQPKSYRLPAADLKQQVIWGSVCEVTDGPSLAFGGQDQKADDGQPHTRIKVEGQWRALHEDLRAANPLQSYHDRCWALRQCQKTLAARARYIYLQGQPATEQGMRVGQDVLPGEKKLEEDLGRLIADLKKAAAGLKGYEAGQARLAHQGLESAGSQLKALAVALAEGLTSEIIQNMAAVQIALEKAAEALDAEPPPRALSTIVYDAKSRLLLIFGGDHLDYLTNDTWAFDPAKRKWQQRHPASAPPPRANHSLTASGDGTLKLTGGYRYRSSISYCGDQYQDVGDGPWVYDVAADAWSGKGMAVAPDSREYRTGPFHPDFFLQGPAPDAAAVAEELRALPLNTWVERKCTHRPQLDRVWSTAVFDGQHEIILLWGGGHSAHGGTDVLHYHLATNRWELPYPVEFPLGQLYSNTSYPEGFNFNRRPWVTGHTYESYNYDPLARKMFFNGKTWNCYVYDPEVADWTGRFPKPRGMAYNDCYYTLMTCATPHGLIVWTAHGKVFQLDAAASRWVELATSGAKLPGSAVDSSTVVYDSRRDRLLFFPGQYGRPCQGEVFALDIRGGTVSTMEPQNRAAMAALALKGVDRACYNPQSDLVLTANLLPGSDEMARPSLAYDCQGNRWVALDIKYAMDREGRKPAIPRGSGHSCGLIVDVSRRLIWGVNTLERRVYALHLDARNANPRPLSSG